MSRVAAGTKRARQLAAYNQKPMEHVELTDEQVMHNLQIEQRRAEKALRKAQRERAK